VLKLEKTKIRFQTILLEVVILDLNLP